jgi:hypothetical protein
MDTTPKTPHRWYSPVHIAALLDATQHGTKWRARCPVHGGDNTQALGIAEGHDSHGHPLTLLHCFAHQCPVEDICAALGISVKNLFCMTPAYYDSMRPFPPAKSPRIARLKTMEEPTPAAIAQLLLEEMIVSDPAWIETCEPARRKLWAFAQQPTARAAFTRALVAAKLPVKRFWDALSEAYGEKAPSDD